MEIFFIIFLLILILGVFVGSFLDVTANRIVRGEKFLGGRSHCEGCKKNLTWKELVPVVSFLVQKGKCKNCSSKLSLEYPLVEIGTGLLFALTYSLKLTANLASFGELLFWLVLVSALITLFITDLKYYLLPNKILLPTIGLALVVEAMGGIGGTRVVEGLTVAVGASAFFLTLVLVTKGKGMGGGDVKLAFLMGVLLGWPLTLIALYLSFFGGAIVALILIALHKKRFGQVIPFGPFMIISTWISLFWPDQLLGICKIFLSLI